MKLLVQRLWYGADSKEYRTASAVNAVEELNAMVVRKYRPTAETVSMLLKFALHVSVFPPTCISAVCPGLDFVVLKSNPDAAFVGNYEMRTMAPHLLWELLLLQKFRIVGVSNTAQQPTATEISLLDRLISTEVPGFYPALKSEVAILRYLPETLQVGLVVYLTQYAVGIARPVYHNPTAEEVAVERFNEAIKPYVEFVKFSMKIADGLKKARSAA